MVNSVAPFVCILLLSLALTLESRFTLIKEGVNGGAACATCSVLLSLIEKFSVVRNISVDNALTEFCSLLPVPYIRYCKMGLLVSRSHIVDGFNRGGTPESICQSLDFCYDTPGLPKCRMHPPQSASFDWRQSLRRRKRGFQMNSDSLKTKIANLPGIKEIWTGLQSISQNHLPVIDRDHDKFGAATTLRGSAWRGKDCNDTAAAIHPGAHAVQDDAVTDHNCNGISGIDSNTNTPWEAELCDETHRMGIAVLGDSISAHFHFPEQWIDARQFSATAFEHLASIVEDEFDWPQLSAMTGYTDNKESTIEGPTRSLYGRLVDLDRCNHRDYQNIAVNGARSGAMLEIMRSLARDPQNDVPLLVIYSLVGNDVCNGELDTLAHTATVEEMRSNVLGALTYLDTMLPKGSHVLTVGFTKGSLLYEIMHDRPHPFGRVGTPITYAQVYDYLSCLQISSCNGWLTSNATLRALTTQRAVELSAAVRDASFAYQPRNYDIDYLDFPFDAVIDEWAAQGGQPWQIIESADGFHINQYGQALISDVLWSWLQMNKPQWLPPVNPRNADIERMFGDQGGY